jgi:hypothetical protein
MQYKFPMTLDRQFKNKLEELQNEINKEKKIIDKL